MTFLKLKFYFFISLNTVGMDIPDYIASGGGQAEAIKSMSEKMKALGKRRRK